MCPFTLATSSNDTFGPTTVAYTAGIRHNRVTNLMITIRAKPEVIVYGCSTYKSYEADCGGKITSGNTDDVEILTPMKVSDGADQYRYIPPYTISLSRDQPQNI